MHLVLALAGCGGVDLRAGNGGALPGEPTGLTLTTHAPDGGPWAFADVAVSTSRDGLAWRPATDVAVEASPPVADVMLVLDNSGSVIGAPDDLRDAALGFAAALYGAQAGYRVGLVRVSTEASVLAWPTDDPEVFADAVDEVFVSNGWTALWDGVRLANDALVQAADGEPGPRAPIVVLFAGGPDNNSAGEHAETDDDIDTRSASLLDLSVAGVRTSVHVVELGEPPAGATPLGHLAAATGGTHAYADDLEAVPGALEDTAAAITSQVRVRFTPADCADTHARVEAVAYADGATTSAATTAPIPALCD